MYRQNHKHLSIVLTIFLFMGIFLVSAVHAADLTLTWNKPDDSRVIGYNIYCGISGTNYTSTPVQTINSADQTSCLITNLEEGQVYDFTATSIDAEDNESDFATSINYLVAVTPTDNDGDGYTLEEGDCNDNDASIHPGAIEICNDSIDQNCDGIDCYQESLEDIDNDGDGFTANEGDCNDNDPTIYPGATEACGDGIDQDCNGSDLECVPDPNDVDNDGDGYTENEGDCNDNDATIFPGAIEICGDGIDQDCNGSDLLCTAIDGLTLSWTRPDDDRVAGYNIYCGKTGTEFKLAPYVTIYSAGTTSYTFTDLEDGFEYSFAATSFDTEGTESDFSETVTYLVGDSGDLTDETQTVVFGDTLNAGYPGTIVDTFINLNEDVNYAGEQLNTYTWPENMPANAIMLKFDLSAIPADAQIQSATLSLYQTAAGGDAAYEIAAHKIINHNPDLYQATGYTFDGTNNWTANNISYNSIPLAQADIATAEDVNSLDLNSGYKGWNVSSMVKEWVSNASSNYGLLLNSDSVAGSNSYRFFASSEAIDAGQRPQLEIVYTVNASVDVDADDDGYTIIEGDCNDNDASIHPGAAEICGDGIDQDCNGSDLICPEDIDNDSDGYTENEGDCNDSDASVHPGAAEICGDGIDQDCNGSDLICPEDIDNDSDGYTINQGDCNDNDASIHPGATEVCGDGIDQDCNGSDLTCPEDIDNDGDGYTENQGDCNDSDASIHPGAAEICGDGIDQDCNGSDLTCPEDIDNDGDGYTENEGDCNDRDASIYPGAIEICGDGIDQDCDGMDFECLLDPSDVDDDGDGYTENEGDCNDNDATIFPGAIEICGDGIDQDCDGSDLECIREEVKGFVMETGEAEINHDWQFVSFTKTFVNPIVVAKPMSLNGEQPAVIRINNVTREGFEIRIQEWDYLDGWHAYESVGYIVMEAGHHVLPTGIHVEAGTSESSSALKTVNFDAAFNQIPVLVSGVTTENEPDAVTGRLSNITQNGFDIMLQEQESSKNGHYADETLSYIAWEPSSGEVDGMSYIVDSTFNEVTHKFTNLGFYPVFESAPAFIADMQTTNGGDTANVRWQNKTGEGIEVQIHEEQSQNPEMNHVTEVVGYMAFSLIQ